MRQFLRRQSLLGCNSSLVEICQNLLYWPVGNIDISKPHKTDFSPSAASRHVRTAGFASCEPELTRQRQAGLAGRSGRCNPAWLKRGPGIYTEQPLCGCSAKLIIFWGSHWSFRLLSLFLFSSSLSDSFLPHSISSSWRRLTGRVSDGVLLIKQAMSTPGTT